MIKYLRIDHVALHVKNLTYSKSFYEKHFGFQTYFEHTTPNEIPIAYLKLGDTILELTGIEDSPVKGFHFCLEVDNFDEAVEKLVKDGVKIIQKPHKATARHYNEEKWQLVVFEGPDAEQIELRG